MKSNYQFSTKFFIVYLIAGFSELTCKNSTQSSVSTSLKVQGFAGRTEQDPLLAEDDRES